MNKINQSSQLKRKTGSEPFHNNGTKLSFSLLDFWQWYASDLLNNSTRGILAEYLVTKAIDSSDKPRKEWDTYDVLTKEGLKIEVKSASYIQSWDQKDFSKIAFNVRPTRAWDSILGKYSTQYKRQADVYVFCVLHHQDQSTIDPTDLAQWSFYLITTNRLNETIGNQKSIRLKRLLEIGASLTSYSKLKKDIQDLFSR